MAYLHFFASSAPFAVNSEVVSPLGSVRSTTMVRAECCGFKVGKMTSEVGEFVSEVGENRAEVGEFGLKVGEKQAEVGEFGLKVGEKQAEVGDLLLDNSVTAGTERFNLARICLRAECRRLMADCFSVAACSGPVAG